MATFALCLLVLELAADRSFEGRVTTVVEGDTVVVLDGNRPTRVRLAGIDAPQPGQPFADKAKRHLNSALIRKKVLVRVRDRDDLGQVNGEIILASGRSVALELVNAGLAWCDPGEASTAPLAKAEAEARKGRRGLWSSRDPIPPWEWKERHRVHRSPAASRPRGKPPADRGAAN